ncbi:MAG: glycosyltransferase family 2 protein [bacterium]
MKKISCIVPAYNEGERITNVLEVVSAHSRIDEIIVVNDGSTDNTLEVIKGFLEKFEKIKLINHEKNKGKSASLHDALEVTTGEFIFFLDSDLVGLTEQNITDLADPIVTDSADVSLSLRRNSPRFWHMIGLDYISGERILPKKVFAGQMDNLLSLKPFGFEVFLNRLIIRNNFRIKVVVWPNVDSPYKVVKNGLWKGIKGDFFMMLDIFRTISIFGPIYQIIKIKSLMIK